MDNAEHDMAVQLGKWLEKRLCVLESEAYDAAIEILNGDWKEYPQPRKTEP